MIGLTYNPVHALEQVASIFLSPQLDARVHIHPTRDVLEIALNAGDLGRPDIIQPRTRVPVER